MKMKHNLYIGLFACAIALTACDSAINNFMVDDTVALLTPGLVKESVYLGLDNPTEVYVLKSGKGFSGANVSISVDNEVLATYNATVDEPIAAMPEDCYTITVSSLSLSPDDYQLPFRISWNRDRLAAVLADNPNVGIPLRLKVGSEGVNVNEDRLTTIIQPVIDIPLVSLSQSGYQIGLMPTRRTSLEELVYMNVQANFIPERDIDYTLSIDASLIEEYNQAHGTDYKLLPAEAYKIDLEGWKIRKSMKTNRFHFTFCREALIPEDGPSRFGEYILPIRISSVSLSDVNPEKSYVLYTVSVIASRIDKSKWSIYSCSSDIRSIANWEKVEGNYPPANLIDGTTNTHWRTVWSIKDSSDPRVQFPVEVVIDLGETRDLYKVGIDAPTGTNRRYFNSKSGVIEVSDSPEGPWTKVSDWIYPSKTTSAYEFDVDPASARYVKFVVSESFDGTTKMAISELTLWGE
jgi:hypothetical protein